MPYRKERKAERKKDVKNYRVTLYKKKLNFYAVTNIVLAIKIVLVLKHCLIMHIAVNFWKNVLAEWLVLVLHYQGENTRQTKKNKKTKL